MSLRWVAEAALLPVGLCCRHEDGEGRGGSVGKGHQVLEAVEEGVRDAVLVVKGDTC